MKWRKTNNSLHSYLGYFFFGMSIIYALSGLAMNHINDWDPSYIILTKEIEINSEQSLDLLDEAGVRSIFGHLFGKYDYKSHYYPDNSTIKIFSRVGAIIVDIDSKKGIVERIVRKPLFFGVNFLHYNPIKYWTYFADIFCVSVIIISITGLIIRRKRSSISGLRGWLVLGGFVIPFVYIGFLVDFGNF